MRTTIRIDEALLAEARLRAARRGQTLSDVVEEALRETFARRAAGPLERPSIPVFRGSRLLPGIDLDDSASLLEAMENGEP